PELRQRIARASVRCACVRDNPERTQSRLLVRLNRFAQLIERQPKAIVRRNFTKLLAGKPDDAQSALDGIMGLVGEIDRRVRDSVAEFCRARRVERGEIRGGTAAHEKSTGRFGKPAEAPEPIDDVQLDRRRGRATKPGAVENVETGNECVRHRADKISRARNEREEARMIDVKIVWENVFFE